MSRFISVVSGKGKFADLFIAGYLLTARPVLETLQPDKAPSPTPLPEAVAYYRDLLKKDRELICLFSSNVEVNSFNDAVLEEEAAESYHLSLA
jgi:hypothetical protein